MGEPVRFFIRNPFGHRLCLICSVLCFPQSKRCSLHISTIKGRVFAIRLGKLGPGRLVHHSHRLDFSFFFHSNSHRKCLNESLRCFQFFHDVTSRRYPFQNVSLALCHHGCKRITGILFRCDPGVFHHIGFALPVEKSLCLFQQHSMLLYSVCRMIIGFQIVRKLRTYQFPIAVIQLCRLIIAFAALLIIIHQTMPVIDRIHGFLKASIVVIQKDFLI